MPSSSSAIGRIASVFPVPVPATMPKPRRARASSRTRAPKCCSRYVSMWRPTASSIVSHAARVGAMTITRPVGGSAPTNASWSGGRYWSLTSRMRAGGARNVRGARVRYGLLAILAELADERRLALLALVRAVLVVVTEDHPAVGRAVADGRRAVRRCRLLLGRHLVQPDAAHALRGPVLLGNVVLALLRVRRSSQTGRADESEEGGAKLHQILQCHADIARHR